MNVNTGIEEYYIPMSARFPTLLTRLVTSDPKMLRATADPPRFTSFHLAATVPPPSPDFRARFTDAEPPSRHMNVNTGIEEYYIPMGHFLGVRESGLQVMVQGAGEEGVFRRGLGFAIVQSLFWIAGLEFTRVSTLTPEPPIRHMNVNTGIEEYYIPMGRFLQIPPSDPTDDFQARLGRFRVLVMRFGVWGLAVC
jgi:hypothetical protein